MSARQGGCRKLSRSSLECLALLRTPRVGREQARHLRQHRQQGIARGGARGHRTTELAQEQDRSRLASVVGALPVPGAIGITAPECLVHRVAEPGGIDPAPAFEISKKQLHGMEQVGCMVESLTQANAGRGSGSRGGGGRRHDGSLGGWGRTEPRALSQSGSARPVRTFPLALEGNSPAMSAEATRSLQKKGPLRSRGRGCIALVAAHSLWRLPAGSADGPRAGTPICKERCSGAPR